MKWPVVLACALAMSCALALTEDEEAEIAAASEAAPHVTTDATFMIFRDGRFRTIRAGKNNFTCLVMSNPRGCFEPACLNEEAMTSIFPTYEYHTARAIAL